MVLKWFYSLSRRKTFVGGKYALPSALLVSKRNRAKRVSRTQQSATTNVETSYFTQLKICYLMTTFRCPSVMAHKSAITDHVVEENLGQGKSGRQRGTATDQMDKRGTLDQEDTDVYESGCRILPTQPHVGPGDFQVTCSIEL